MSTSGKDKIYVEADKVIHESSGGFIFFDDSETGLMVPLIKKIDGTYWMPKGHVMEGETSEDAAIRELTEELSLEVKPRFIGKVSEESYSFNLPNDQRTHYKVVHVFAFEVDKKLPISSKEMQNISGEKGRFAEPEWLSVQDAISKLTFDKNILEKSVEVYKKYKNND